MKFLQPLLFLILLLVAILACLIIYATLTWYNPPEKFVLNESQKPDTVRTNITFHLLSWNIGYAGLGDNMDFFYDGGRKVRDTRERVQLNLDSIRDFIHRKSSSTFILIQELDLHSKRSYYLNQENILLAGVRYQSSVALNYAVGFVPVPLLSPMGRVKSGVMTMSRYMPECSVRYAYPGMFGWPSRLFNLRRCMLVNYYPTDNGKQLVLVNSHLSAFDDGSLKKQEMQYLKDFALTEFGKGNYVVVGGDWNQSPPEFSLTRFGANYQSDSFLLNTIPEDFMPVDWTWAFDSLVPTNRYLNEPYTPGKTFRCLIDFFLVSPNVEVIKNETFELNFRNSDHNPIGMEFRLER